MSIIQFQVVDDLPGQQIHLKRLLSHDEQLHLKSLADFDIDGDHLDEPDHPHFRCWLNLDSVDPAIAEYLESLE